MRRILSIWFFAGILFSIYGVVILATGLWELRHAPAHLTVLANLHASIWWGAILLLAGVGYFIAFFPKSTHRRP
jgi:hypothetical protein